MRRHISPARLRCESFRRRHDRQCHPLRFKTNGNPIILANFRKRKETNAAIVRPELRRNFLQFRVSQRKPRRAWSRRL